MQVSVQSDEGLVRHMVVELPREDIEQEVEKRIKDAVKTAHINGFRPGKVPVKIVRSRYAAKIQQEVCDDLMKSSFDQAISEEQLRPVGAPVIEKPMELNSWDQKNFSYTVSFETLPDIIPTSLSDYTVNRPVVEITDADVDEMMESLRSQRKTWQVVERPVQQGDKITLSIKNVTPDKPEDVKHDAIAESPFVLGSDSTNPIIEAGLVGMSIGETRTFELPPDDTQTDADAGSTAKNVNVTVGTISQPLLPELNADFIAGFGVTDGNIEAFKKSIRAGMETKLTEQIQQVIKRQVMDILMIAYPIQLPKILVEHQQGILLKDSDQKGGEKLDEQLIETLAARRVALRLIIEEITQKNNIVLDIERVQRAINKTSEEYEDTGAALRHYETKEERTTIEDSVIDDQVVDWVLSEVKMEDAPIAFKEIMAAADH